ncbi:MAG TPA: hypothetical protein VJ011_08450 [Steroidobacteraceae bacterium]|nr:hypothetical protein [Steroidobacteraceae bacterium]
MPDLRTGPDGPLIVGTAVGDLLVWDGVEWVPTPGGGGAPPPIVALAANTASVDSGYPDGFVVLRTGSNVNPAGAYNGGGTGNKALLGVPGFSGLPIAALLSISYTWENLLGPTGVPGPVSVTVPFGNLIVDFAPPPGPGDLRVLSLLDRQLAAAISASIGSYADAGPLHTHTWLAVETAPGINGSVCIIGVTNPPGAATPPGGCPVNVTVGAGQFENTYRWTDLIATNPTAVLVDAFPANAVLFPTGDGGMPVGAVTPAILVVSGDSANIVKSGKRIVALTVNGTPIVPL